MPGALCAMSAGRLGARLRDDVLGTGLRRGAGHGQLPGVVRAARERARRQQDRRGDRLAEELDSGRDRRHVARHTRHEPPLLPRNLVVVAGREDGGGLEVGRNFLGKGATGRGRQLERIPRERALGIVHAATTSGPRTPMRRSANVRASGSAPGCSCGYDLRPSNADATQRECPGLRICAWLFMRLRPPALERRCDAARMSGPPDLRLAVHAATTSGPRTPMRRSANVRASGSAPGCSCGYDLRPSNADATQRECPGLRICAWHAAQCPGLRICAWLFTPATVPF